MILQPNQSNQPNTERIERLKQEISINDIKSRLFASIIGSYTSYYLQNHSGPSGQLDLDQVDTLTDEALVVYDISFRKLLGISEEGRI